MALFGRLFGKKPAAKPVAIPVGRGGLFNRPVTGKPTGNRPLPRIVTFEDPIEKPVAVPQPITLGRGEHPTGERTSIAVPHEMVSAFIAGTFTYVTSSWLASAQYDQKRQELHVTFLDGFSCYVEDVSESEAAQFYAAPSKGGWYWDVVLGPNYVKGVPSTAAKRWH